MWAQLTIATLGIWLMASPAIFDFDKNISDNAHIAGPLIVSFSVVAIWECTRNVRFFNLPLALWLLIAPWILGYENNTALFNDYAVAGVIVGFLFIKRKRENYFGGGWPAVWKSNSQHSRKAGNPHQIRLKTASRH